MNQPYAQLSQLKIVDYIQKAHPKLMRFSDDLMDEMKIKRT
jgi:hypothetical protein